MAKMESVFTDRAWRSEDREEMDRDGHIVLPGFLTADARTRLVEALSHIQSLMPGDEDYKPSHYAAEYNDYLASLIGHPQMRGLVHEILGQDIRYDHCVSLNRPGGNGGAHWHSHEYGETKPELGFVRIFFYVNGFAPGDGALKVVRGSHLFRDASIDFQSDGALRDGWIQDKVHPVTGQPLEIEELSAPGGSVVLMWTHAAHAVTPRQAGSDTRWTVVYAYRNPGQPSRARWLSEAFEERGVPGAEGLLSLY